MGDCVWRTKRQGGRMTGTDCLPVWAPVGAEPSKNSTCYSPGVEGGRELPCLMHHKQVRECCAVRGVNRRMICNDTSALMATGLMVMILGSNASMQVPLLPSPLLLTRGVVRAAEIDHNMN